MIIKYRILKRNKSDNTFEIRYFTDVITEDSLSSSFDNEGNIIRNKDGYPERCRTDMCINIQNPDPKEEEIHELAKNNALYYWLKLQEDIILGKTEIKGTYVNKMIGKIYSFESSDVYSDQSNGEFDIDVVLTQNNISKLVTALKNTNEF